MEPVLQVFLLGSFELKYKGETLTTIHSTRLQSLFAYMLLHRRTAISRQQLAGVFWPETSEAQARTNLRNLLHQLRQDLPEADRYLQFAGQEMQWAASTPLILDVDEFECGVQVQPGQPDELAKLTCAVNLYRGDLLPGCYDDWLEPERERLRRQLANALDRLAGLQAQARDYQAAIATAEHLVQLDELDERAYRHLMRMHALAGDRAGARRVFQACAVALKKELSVEPEPETRLLYDTLKNEVIPPLASAGRVETRPRPLVGREHEWAQMQQAWNLARKGHPHCLLLSGEAGIGKTRLAEEMLQWASCQGFLTAAARCFAGEGGLAYAPAADWLRTGALRKRWLDLEPVWLVELEWVLPEINAERPGLPRPERLNADWQRRRLFEAMVRALSPPALPEPVPPMVLLIDDLQWCDSDTLAWLHFLVRSPFPAKLLLVATLRPEELAAGSPLASWLGDLRSSARLDEVALGPLSEAETRMLAENETGHVLEPEAARRLFNETEGHPLFVVETLRMAGDTGPTAADWLPSARPSSPSPTVQAVIARRLSLLSPAGRDLAGLAATIGHSFTYLALTRANKELDEATLVRALDELWQRRIVCEQGESAYDFSHDKIRAAAYQGLSTARRRYLHRCVAESLEDMARGNPSTGPGDETEELSGQIGSHYENAGAAERAVPFYRQAAEVARRVFANERALRYFQSALALLCGPLGRAEDLLQAALVEEQMGDLLLLMTRRAEARAAFERGFQLLPPSERIGRAALLRKIGNTWRDEYHFRESLEIYNRAMAVLGSHYGPEEEDQQDWWQCRIQTQVEIQNVYYWLAWIEISEALYREMLPDIERHASFLQRADFFKMMGMLRLRANGYLATDEMVALVETALEARRKAGDSEIPPADRFGHGFILLFHGDLEPAEREIDTALHLAQQRGDLSLETRCLTYLAIVQRKRGNVSRTLDLARQGQASAEAAKMPEYTGAARANLAWAALKEGDLPGARQHGLAALELWSQSADIQAAATPYYWTAIWPLVGVCLAEDDLAGAFSYARTLLEPQRKKLPADLEKALARAVDAWNAGHPQAGCDALLSAAGLAETLGEF